MLMYFWNSSPTDCLAVSITYNSSKQWSTGERIVYFTVCFISWVPEVFSRVRRGASSADTSSAKGRRHERRRVPRAPRVTVTQSICFTSPHRLDYQPLFGKMSPHSHPPLFGEDQRPDPGDGGNRAYSPHG